MSIEIYQSNAGYLWVEDREIPLYNAQWVHSISLNNDYISIISGDDVVLRSAALRHIVDNNSSGYANITEFSNWWNTLLTNNDVPYSFYTAFVTQTGVAAPSASVLSNTVGAITIGRTSAGVYTFTSAGKFTENKTVPVSEIYDDPITGNRMKLEWTNVNTITLTTYLSENLEVPADGVLSNQYIHFEIFN